MGSWTWPCFLLFMFKFSSYNIMWHCLWLLRVIWYHPRLLWRSINLSALITRSLLGLWQISQHHRQLQTVEIQKPRSYGLRLTIGNDLFKHTYCFCLAATLVIKSDFRSDFLRSLTARVARCVWLNQASGHPLAGCSGWICPGFALCPWTYSFLTTWKQCIRNCSFSFYSINWYTKDCALGESYF